MSAETIRTLSNATSVGQQQTADPSPTPSQQIDASKLFSNAAASVRLLAGCWADISVADDQRVNRAVNCADPRPSGFTEILSHNIVKYVIYYRRAFHLYL